MTVRTFRPGEDDAAWLALNAAAFAHHPEQGSLTQRDLDDRKAEPWFDPAGFFLAERDGRAGRLPLDEGAQRGTARRGLRTGRLARRRRAAASGKTLTAIGLRHLERDRGLPTAMLYVDADNLAAVSVYEGLGFPRTRRT